MELLDFLKLVLPDQGHYCWVAIHNKKARQGFVSTLDALEAKLLEEDETGVDIYFACSSFKEPKSRQAVNVLGTKAFWFDIDAGEGKPYKDADAAAEALNAFCEVAGLPYATVVCSGYGIHAWWPLEQMLEPKQWKEYAERLKRLSEIHGLSVDPTRTADIASILRPVGTRNYKSPDVPRKVSVWAFEGEEPRAYPLSAFDTARVDVVANWDKIKPKDDDLSLTKGYPDGERTKALVARAGSLLGPAHNYTEDQAVIALMAWNENNNPPLEGGKIKSTVASIAKSELSKRRLAGVGANLGLCEQLPKLPYGYKWDSQGRMITSVPIKDTEEWEDVQVTEFPLYLEAVSRKEREFNQSYIFHQYLPKEGWRNFQILCSDFEGQSWKSHLAKNGGNCVSNDKLFKNYVHHADAELRRKQVDAIRYQQFGWKNEDTAFLVGDTLIHNTGKIERVYPGEEIEQRTKQMVPAKGGSLNEWSADANCLFRDDYIHLGFCLVSSFASVLLKLCMDQSDGGIVLSLVSSGSGKGKSKILEAASSVWGQLEALQITYRDTVNAKFSIISSASHLPIFMDEWNEKDPQVAANFIKQYTVGHDKNRAQKDGSVKSKPAEYKNLLITTSNRSLYETVQMSHDEGALARIVEIVAPDIEGEAFKRMGKITNNMLRNSGYAGREFIYQLMQPEVLDSVKAQLEKSVEHFRSNLNTSGRHRYVAWLPAAVLVAGGLLIKTGILEFDLKRLMEWSMARAAERIEEVTSAPALDMLGQFVSEHSGSSIIVNGPYAGKLPLVILNNNGNPPSKTLMRGEKESKKLYIATFAIRTWLMKNGRSYGDIAKELESSGVLLNRKRYTTLGAGTFATTSRIPCWEIDMAHSDVSGELSAVISQSVQQSEASPSAP